MTSDELYAKGYSLEWSIWGVTVYRTIDGSAEPSVAAVERTAVVNFETPLKETEAAARGWEAAAADFVKRRLAQ